MVKISQKCEPSCKFSIKPTQWAKEAKKVWKWTARPGHENLDPSLTSSDSKRDRAPVWQKNEIAQTEDPSNYHHDTINLSNAVSI